MDAQEIAGRRTRLHRGDRSQRILSAGHDLVGIAGEIAFADRFGFAVDTTERRRGDKGIDFVTPAGTVDVKTRRRAVSLLCEVGKPLADLLVLAAYNERLGTAELVGWCDRGMVLMAPVQTGNFGITNHVVNRSHLRPMCQLAALIDYRRN